MSKIIQKTKNVQKLISTLGSLKGPKEISEKLKEIEDALEIYSSGAHLKFNEIQMKAFLTKFKKLVSELEELRIMYKDYLK